MLVPVAAVLYFLLLSNSPLLCNSGVTFYLFTDVFSCIGVVIISWEFFSLFQGRQNQFVFLQYRRTKMFAYMKIINCPLVHFLHSDVNKIETLFVTLLLCFLFD